MDQVEERAVFTVPEAGARLGLSRAAAYAAAQNGELPTIRIGRRLMVPKVAFERLLASPGRENPLPER